MMESKSVIISCKKRGNRYSSMQLVELERCQREYIQALNRKQNSRKTSMLQKKYELTRKNLVRDKNNLKATIYVAQNKSFKKINKDSLYAVKCHVSCQEKISIETQKLKSIINNLNHQICNCNKDIYYLTRKLVNIPSNTNMYISPVSENKLEVLLNRECKCCATNEALRQQIFEQLEERRLFNQQYSKLVHQLTSDKKYLMELIDYALGKFENCIGSYEKTENLIKRRARELEQRKFEMENLVWNIFAKEQINTCQIIKSSPRKVGDIQPKEYQRRAKQRLKCQRKIQLYERILDKILAYTRCRSVSRVIEKYKEQESLYYSYFNYANELSYHMTLLNNSANRLYTDINGLKLLNRNNFQHQMETVNHLASTLASKRRNNKKLEIILNEHNQRIGKLFDAMQLIRDYTRTDMEPMKAIFDHSISVNPVNLRNQMKMIEQRVSAILAIVYCRERQNTTINAKDYVVREIEKLCEWPTDLKDIVLAQLCPECAKSDEDGDVCTILSLAEIKKKLYEKVLQPEMQYIIHSISECRLPRARFLVSRRNSN